METIDGLACSGLRAKIPLERSGTVDQGETVYDFCLSGSAAFCKISPSTTVFCSKKEHVTSHDEAMDEPVFSVELLLAAKVFGRIR
jgi:hypothetical protein